MAAAEEVLDQLKDDSAQPLPIIRETVRDLLLSSVAYHKLDPDKRQEVAQSLVRVCHTAVSLIKEEEKSDRLVAAQSFSTHDAEPDSSAKQPFAVAQTAGQDFSGVSAERVAGTTRAILNAVSFPRFVTELINGVFKALIDSNQQQMNAYVELIKNVSASTEGFADANLAPGRAREWLAETFPGSFAIQGGPDEDTDPRDVEEERQESRLRLVEGGSMPSEEALRTTLGIAPGESVPSGDPETSIVPFARRALARQRQQMLATMVMLGMQRIVIESGRLNASMRFHIDTRSVAQSDAGSRLDAQTSLEASGSFGYGPWGASAKMSNTIGYVSTQRSQTTEEMNTDLDLNSSVELYFKTDYVPLDRLAGATQVDRIKVNTLNPSAEENAAAAARAARVTAARAADALRSTSTQDALRHQSTRETPPTGGSNSAARQDTQTQRGQPTQTGSQQTGGPQTGGPSTVARRQVARKQVARQQTAGQQTAGQQTAGQQTLASKRVVSKPLASKPAS